MKAHVIICLAVAVAGGNPNTSAQGFGFVSPQGSSQDGNSSILQPFSVPSSRYQQIYGLQPLFSSDAYFSSIVFRLDATNGSTFNGQMFVQVRMSTTPQAVDSLSPVFADNIGPDETTVFSGLLQWSAIHHTPSTTPEPLDLRIDLQQPFLYRPSMGNLLVDFNMGGSTISSQLDAWNRASDSVSSVFTPSFGSPSGTPSTLGLVTYFAGTVVPEPAPVALGLIGIAAFAFMRRKRNQTKL